jgi:DNA-binding MarR family transcriptional regulator
LASPGLAPPVSLVDQILDQLEPLIARQRRAVAREGCLRQISTTQLHVLFLLVNDGPMPMSQLADLLAVSMSNVTGIVERMVEKDLVERLRDDADRRLVKVGATEAGRHTVEEIDMVRRREFGRLLNLLTPEQQQRALATFSELRAAAENEIR